MADVGAASADLSACLPPGTTYVLIDQGNLGGEQLSEGRTGAPSGAREGAGCGPPVDDSSAIQDLEWHRRHGTQHVVFWRDAFWWLDYYPDLACYLRESG